MWLWMVYGLLNGFWGRGGGCERRKGGNEIVTGFRAWNGGIAVAVMSVIYIMVNTIVKASQLLVRNWAAI